VESREPLEPIEFIVADGDENVERRLEKRGASQIARLPRQEP